MRAILFSVLIFVLAGCAHHQPSVYVTEQQLTQFTGKALAVIRAKEPIQLPDGSRTPIVGDHDSSKPIHYSTRARPRPAVIIRVPTLGASSFTYIKFIFDADSGAIIGIGYGLIH